jgi:hypothetical protein
MSIGLLGSSNINDFYAMLYGTGGVDFEGILCSWFGGTTGQVFTWNPPYTLIDFLGIYPKFFGPATTVDSLTITLGSADVTGFTSTNISNLAIGDLIYDPSFPNGTVIKSINTGTNTVTMFNAAIDNASSLQIYEQPPVPVLVISTFLNLAMASVMFSRYNENWTMMMAWFIAHYLTMYLRSENLPPDADISQIASSGLSKGILVQRAAGDVSATSKLLAELNNTYANFGAFNETIYGEQFMTIAAATACGPVYVL